MSFTDLLNEAFSEEYCSLFSIVNNDLERNEGYIQVGPLALMFSSEDGSEGSVIVKGFDSEQCHCFIEDYLGIPNRPKRDSSLSDIDNNLAGEATEVTLLSRGSQISHNGWLLRLHRDHQGSLCLNFSLDESGRDLRQYSENKGLHLISCFHEYLEKECLSVIPFVDISPITHPELLVSHDEEGAQERGSDDAQKLEEAGSESQPERSSGGSKPTSVISSESSRARMRLAAQGHPFVEVTVDHRSGAIHFFMSAQRPKTEYGRTQASHFIAYVLLVRAVLESMDNQYIHEVPEILIAVAKHFIDDNQHEILENNVKAELTTAHRQLDRNRRKKLTAELRDKGVEASIVQDIKLAIKVRSATFPEFRQLPEDALKCIFSFVVERSIVFQSWSIAKFESGEFNYEDCFTQDSAAPNI